MPTNELKQRTKNFSLMIIDLVEKLPNSISTTVVVNQIVRSGTSVELITEQFVELEVIENLFLK